MTSDDRDNLLDPSLKTPGIGFGGGAASYSGSSGGSGYGGSGYGSGYGDGSGSGFGSGDGGGDFWGGGCGRGGTNSNDGEERYEIDIPNEHDDNEKGTP